MVNTEMLSLFIGWFGFIIVGIGLATQESLNIFNLLVGALVGLSLYPFIIILIISFV
jgi:hypothetical protein